ncbi:Cytochrome c oxidase subunit 5b-2, mitochondrial [Vitis vinifera]|uniref:Cytochrome c oxidase subunit 5b-2, mitochondrial n=1 Tax=Vitis vinifera TaxID=29760 RepID=A0A438FEU6_VITVI|nr:Cytochrome c oxidase subunit 5b-2, mitochondrial [Vitis vinifera]
MRGRHVARIFQRKAAGRCKGASPAGEVVLLAGGLLAAVLQKRYLEEKGVLVIQEGDLLGAAGEGRANRGECFFLAGEEPAEGVWRDNQRVIFFWGILSWRELQVGSLRRKPEVSGKNLSGKQAILSLLEAQADNSQGLTASLNGCPSGVLSVISGYGPTSGAVCADHINTDEFVFIKASGVRDSVAMLDGVIPETEVKRFSNGGSVLKVTVFSKIWNDPLMEQAVIFKSDWHIPRFKDCEEGTCTIDVFAIATLSGIMSRLLNTGTVLAATMSAAECMAEGIKQMVVVDIRRMPWRHQYRNENANLIRLTEPIQKRVEEVMPIATGQEREELEVALEGRDILDADHPVGLFGTKEAPAVVQSDYDKKNSWVTWR